MANSTKKFTPDQSSKPDKPYPEFPLTAHPNGCWCKKVKGKLHYFGPWSDPDAALDLWLSQKDALLAGRVPREPAPDGMTLRKLANAYCKLQESKMDAGELSPRTHGDCVRTCAELVDYFGKDRLLDDLRPEDFAAYRVALSKRGLGPVSLANIIRRTQSVLKYADDAGLVAGRVRTGPGVKAPSKKTLRIERAKKPLKLFAPDELRKLIDTAGIPMRCMVLLAANAGLGNSDLANMPTGAVNLETGWVDYARPKTGVGRRFPLWPETLAAVKDALAARPAPRDQADAGLLFLTRFGGRWCKATFEKKADAEGAGAEGGQEDKPKHRQNHDNEVTKEFNKVFAPAGIDRKGRSFYSLRHTFETVAGDSRDQVAVDHIMGHCDNSMSATYREKISDERLKAVTDHVHAWLYAPPKKDKAEEKGVVAENQASSV